MKFTKFLIEREHKSRHELTHLKVAHGLADEHIDQKDNHYEFNLGHVIKDSSLSGLTVRIKKGKEDEVKLGKHKDGRMMLVIFVKNLPNHRSKIEKLLQTNLTIKDGMIKEIGKYKEKHHNEDSDKFTAHEKSQKMGDKDSFEDGYDALISAINDKMGEYKSAVSELEHHEKNTVSEISKSAARHAKEKLREEYFGKTEKEFVKKMFALPEAEFVRFLEKEAVDKLTKRLVSYYEQKA